MADSAHGDLSASAGEAVMASFGPPELVVVCLSVSNMSCVEFCPHPHFCLIIKGNPNLAFVNLLYVDSHHSGGNAAAATMH